MASMDQFANDDYRKLIALQLLKQGMDISPVQHWTQGAARLAQALTGGYLGNQLQQEQMAAMQYNPLSPSGPTADATPSPTSAPMGNKVAEALQTRPPYGANTMPTDQGGSVPVPPSNPLGALSPQMREKFPELRAALAERGVEINAPEAGNIGNIRTPGQQAALYAQGRTAPGPVVTGTLNSNHLTGNALDVVPMNTDAGTVGKMVTALTQTDPRFAGMRSGATFKNLYDPLHVEMNGTRVAQAGPADIPPAAQPTAQSGQAPMQVAQNTQPQGLDLNAIERNVDATLRDPNTSLAIKQKAYAYKQWILQHRMEQSLKYGPEAIAGEAAKTRAQKQAEQDVQFSPGGIAGAARLEGAKEEAGLPAKVVLKGSPSFEDKQKLDQKNQAQTVLTNTVGGMADAYVQLDKMHGIVNPDRGSMENLTARAASSAPGQEATMAVGSKAASVRQQIINSRPALISAIRQATQMGARGLDSNVELQFYLGQASDPTKDIYSNLAALDRLDKAYGLGVGVKEKVSKEMYDKIQSASAQLHSGFTATQKNTNDPLGIR
jgi:hypothetical protein